MVNIGNEFQTIGKLPFNKGEKYEYPRWGWGFKLSCFPCLCLQSMWTN